MTCSYTFSSLIFGSLPDGSTAVAYTTASGQPQGIAQPHQPVFTAESFAAVLQQQQRAQQEQHQQQALLFGAAGQQFLMQQQQQPMMVQAQSAAQLAAASAPPGSMVVVQHPNGVVELVSPKSRMNGKIILPTIGYSRVSSF